VKDTKRRIGNDGTCLEPALADENGIAWPSGVPGGTSKREEPELSVRVRVTRSRRARKSVADLRDKMEDERAEAQA